MNELKTAMTMRGVRPVDLARMAEMSSQQVNAYVNGGRSIGPKLAQIFADALGVSEAYLRGAAQRLAVRDFATGETNACKIMEEVVLDRYGVYYIVDHPQVGPLAVILADGAQFTTRDWRGVQPLEAAEIGLYRWVDAAGRDADMADGRPRMIWGAG